MIKGVAHVAINTTDIEKSLKFYRDTLGFAVAEDMTTDTGLRLVHVQVGEMSTLELFGRTDPVSPIPQGQNAGIVHLALLVDDVDKMYEELQTKGVVFTGPPRSGRGQTKKLVFFKDPDGAMIELMSR